jgi:hypothetical protein
MITPPLRGNTEAAANIDRTTQKYFDSSVALGKQTAYSELTNFWEECKSPDWDGYDALPVQEKTFLNTYSFIEALPLDYPLPSVGAEPDGHLTLEWYRDPRWTLSVSVSPEGILYYAALFGSSDPRGSEQFLGNNIPRSIHDLITEFKARHD